MKFEKCDIDGVSLTNRFVVVIPCYNAEATISDAILSVLNQDFYDLGIVIRDDMSTDSTEKVIKELFNFENTENSFYLKNSERDVLYVKNSKKFYGAGNTYDSVINFIHDPLTVIGVVDGDDYLLKENAISIMYNAYLTEPEKWLIWSQHISRVMGNINFNGFSLPLPPDDVIYSTRSYWAVSHFRTCLAGLYYRIDPLDLRDPLYPEEYAKVCGDAALLYPIIEMCGNKHSLFLNHCLYYYNDGLASNDASVFKSELPFYKNYFENKTRYAQISGDFKL